MKNFIWSGILMGLLFVSCKETVVQNPPQNGALYIDSNPQGAKIFLQGTFNNQYTPATINNLASDSYDIKVEVEEGVDSSFVLAVKSNLTTSASIDFYEKMGKCYFQTTPSGAVIYLDNLNTNSFTPALVGYLKAGIHNYKLALNNYIIEDSFLISQGQLINITYDFNLLLPKGSRFLNSSPVGAQISVDGTNTGKVTPDSVTGLAPGTHTVAFSLAGYRDTIITVDVQANLQSIPPVVVLVSTFSIATYGPVRIYETAGTTISQPAGLDLSTGNAYSVSGGDQDKIDIYYSTSGTGGIPYLIQSADLFPNLTRQTAFYVGAGTNINDDADAIIYPLGGNWRNNMSDRENNYVFLYDEDGHYSKIIITAWGGGSAGNPSWVEVKWLYNNNGADNRF